MGAANALREVGGVFGVAILASVFASHGGYGTPHTFALGLRPAVDVGAVAVGLAALVLLAVPRRKPAIATDPSVESNEITAVPKLLAMLSLKGTIVTMDALNCQRAIAQQIVDQNGHYALALKGNQGSLHDDVRLFLDDPAGPAGATARTVDGDHGRIETRTAVVSGDIDWLQKQHNWPGLAAIAKVERSREEADKTTDETAYYLLSTALTGDRLLEVVRAHWGVENRLHWRLDVVMNEDQQRNRSDNGPANLAVLRHMALNVMQKDNTKGSLRGKIKRAAAQAKVDRLRS